MKSKSFLIRVLVVASVVLAQIDVFAGTDTWTGGGGSGNPFWLNTANWNPAGVPQTSDDLIFTNTIGLVNSNNIGGSFNSITFATPSGAFVLKGSQTTITGGITNKQVTTAQTIEFPIILSGNVNADVTPNGSLTLTNTISGSGSLSKSSGGLLTLKGSNAFTGTLTINGGTVVISTDTNLSSAPTSPTAGNIVLNGGALETTANLNLNINRGIAVGPTSGSGFGAINVDTGTTLTNGSIIANNGGTGGLTKAGFGQMILFGANTYTGPTTNLLGLITLDFSRAGVPLNNIINSSSELVLGGAFAPAGNQSWAQLTTTNSAGGGSQTFSSTHIALGQARIKAVASATNVLGALDHDLGGILTIVPPSNAGGTGKVKTTSANVNGILGGWAFTSDGSIPSTDRGWLVATNWASVDANGNIGNFTGFSNYNSAATYASNFMAPAANLYITGITTVYTNAPDGANTTNDVNSIMLGLNLASTADFSFGSNNLIRLGQYGGVFKYDTGAGNSNILGGVNYGSTLFTNLIYTNWSYNQASAGRLTAGGTTYNNPGEIVLMNTSTSSGGGNNWNIDCSIEDNGPAGTVSVIKAGSGYTKIRNHNKFTGSFYLLGGRIQPSATDIGSQNLQDVFGSGTNPIVIFPGGNLFWAGGSGGITNAALIAGFGAAQEPGLGALRGGDYVGSITLIGDAQIAAGNMVGPISGPFNLTWCASSTAVQSTSVANPNNSWTGNTVITAVQDRTGVETLTLSNSEVIPNGFGKGNVFMMGQAGQTGRFIRLYMNGFNETINGLSSSNGLGGLGVCTAVITNGFDQPLSTLTVGDNDQGGTFGGTIVSNITLVKIGGGVETLTNENAYIGSTTISNGVLQLSGVNASIASSTNVNIFGGTFDVSGVIYTIPSTQPINVSGGAFSISSASGTGSPVSFTNGTLKVASVTLGQVSANLTAQKINVGGVANVIQIASLPPIPAYPQTFPIIHYTSALNGNASTFSGILPPGGFPAFGGFVSNDNTTATIYLVLTNGPVTPQLTWYGSSGGSPNSTWNFTVSDWTNKPAHTASVYSDGSLLIFDDGSQTQVVNLAIDATPGSITFSNNAFNYTLTGTGGLHGAITNSFTKQGTGTVILDNMGTNDSVGPVNIIAGIVQVGKADIGGGLGNGSIGNNGTLVFNRNNSVLNIPNTISGSGSILVSNVPGTTTILSGGSSFTGDMYVKTNLTLDVANANALSSTNGTLTIATNSTLDVSGQGIGANSVAVKKVVSVSGAGVDGTSGAIVNNTTTNQQNALLRVALTGDTTFGGTGRFDIRGTPAQHGALSTGGNAYNLTKKGTFFLSLANVDVDAALNNVDVQGGTLELNGTTTGPGTGGTLTIENSAALQLFSMSNAVSKTIVFGNSLLTNANGNNAITGPMTLNAGLIVGGGTNTTLTLGSAIGGGGSLTKNTVNTLVLTGNNTYAGTTVNDGTLIINGINSGGTLTETYDSASPVPTIVGGNGTNNAPTDIEDTLWPGVIGHPATLSVGNGSDYDLQGSLIFNDSSQGQPKAEFSLNTSTTVGSGVNDLVVVTGDFNGNGYPVRINPLTPLTTGNSYTILTYSGTLVVPTFNAAAVVDAYQPSRYLFSLDHSTAHVIKLNVTQSAGNLVWNNNAANGLWDTNTSANWFNTGTSASDVFLQLDNVTFDDSIGGSSQAVNVAVTNLVPGSVTVNNSAVSYTLFGNGSIGGSTLLKQGNGTLTISNANTFTGTVTVKGGTLAANGNGSLGSGTLTVYGGTVQANAANLSLVSTLITNGTVLVNNTNGLGGVTAPIYVTNSGTLDIGGSSLTANQIPLLGSEPIYISGWGVNSNGCLINSSTNNTQEDAFQNITMTGDAAIGGVGIINGPGRFDIGRLTNNPTFSTGGNPYNLYKVGSNQVSFITVMVDTNLGNIDIKGGELGFEQGTTSMGNPLSNAIVEVGASLEFFASSGTNNFTKQFIINGDGVTTNIIQASGNVTLNGDMALNNIVGIGGAGTTLSNNALMHGTGGVIKSGALNLILTTNETYTGNTTISAGTISLLGNGSINTSPNITVLAGATLNVAARANNTLTLASGQTLRGNGTINGTLTNLVGTILLTGTNGVLTVTTNASFGGSALIANQLDHGSNTVMVVSGSVTYGGTLTVTTNAASTTTLTAGTTYQLFNATTYAGTFSTINLPALNPSLTWDTSQLGNNGTIQVVSAGGSPFTQTPTVTSLSLNGSNVSISGTNGQAGDVYYLLQSTNVALPLSQWTVIATNVISSVGANGSFSFSGTNVIVPADQQQFYILSNTNSNH